MRQEALILVEETDDLIRDLLERWLSEAGHAVVSRNELQTEDGPSPALTPRLVIIDIPDPRSARTLIRSVQQAYASPILVLSARFRRGSGMSRSVAARLGVRAVLPKPFTREELLQAVSELVRR